MVVSFLLLTIIIPVWGPAVCWLSGGTAAAGSRRRWARLITCHDTWRMKVCSLKIATKGALTWLRLTRGPGGGPEHLVESWLYDAGQASARPLVRGRGGGCGGGGGGGRGGVLAGGGGAAALLRPGPGAAELLPADWTRAVQLEPGHDAPCVEAVPALQQPHLLALRQVLTKVTMKTSSPFLSVFLD